MLNEVIVPSSINRVSASLAFSMQPSRYVNFNGRLATYYSHSHLDYEGSSDVRTMHYNHHLDIHILPSSYWRLRWKNVLSHDNDSRKLTYFSDFATSYIHKAFEVELFAQNIFDNHNFERTYVDGLTESYINYSLRRREVLAKVMFSF